MENTHPVSTDNNLNCGTNIRVKGDLLVKTTKNLQQIQTPGQGQGSWNCSCYYLTGQQLGTNGLRVGGPSGAEV